MCDKYVSIHLFTNAPFRLIFPAGSIRSKPPVAVPSDSWQLRAGLFGLVVSGGSRQPPVAPAGLGGSLFVLGGCPRSMTSIGGFWPAPAAPPTNCRPLAALGGSWQPLWVLGGLLALGWSRQLSAVAGGSGRPSEPAQRTDLANRQCKLTVRAGERTVCKFCNVRIWLSEFCDCYLQQCLAIFGS